MACGARGPVLATDFLVLKSFGFVRREGSREYCEDSIATPAMRKASQWQGGRKHYAMLMSFAVRENSCVCGGARPEQQFEQQSRELMTE